MLRMLLHTCSAQASVSPDIGGRRRRRGRGRGEGEGERGHLMKVDPWYFDKSSMVSGHLPRKTTTRCWWLTPVILDNHNKME
jgi:hypothetical protein